jgi:hypothetical protein
MGVGGMTHDTQKEEALHAALRRSQSNEFREKAQTKMAMAKLGHIKGSPDGIRIGSDWAAGELLKDEIGFELAPLLNEQDYLLYDELKEILLVNTRRDTASTVIHLSELGREIWVLKKHVAMILWLCGGTFCLSLLTLMRSF